MATAMLGYHFKGTHGSFRPLKRLLTPLKIETFISTPSKFSDLKLMEPLERAVAQSGYTEPTAIQKAAIPKLL